MSALFAYPRQAEFGRVLPKNKIYEHSGANARLKDLFVEQVDQIVWRYKLAPETINLSAKPCVPEIEIFAIQLKTPELHRDVLRSIDSAIPLPIIFELTHGQGAEARIQVIAAYKRPSEADAAKWVCSGYFATGWMSATVERTPMPLALDLEGLYEQLLHALIPLRARPLEPLAALVNRSEQAAVKQRELERAKARLAKEKQFNRKVGLNATLRQLQNELQGLTT